MRKNALWNCKNPFQGDFQKVLCVCSAGLLRSPTIALVMGNHNYNTRAAGIHDYALVEVDNVLLEWADIIVCAEDVIYDNIRLRVEDKPVYNLQLPDEFPYRDPELIKKIENKLTELELI